MIQNIVSFNKELLYLYALEKCVICCFICLMILKIKYLFANYNSGVVGGGKFYVKVVLLIAKDSAIKFKA